MIFQGFFVLQPDQMQVGMDFSAWACDCFPYLYLSIIQVNSHHLIHSSLCVGGSPNLEMESSFESYSSLSQHS